MHNLKKEGGRARGVTKRTFTFWSTYLGSETNEVGWKREKERERESDKVQSERRDRESSGEGKREREASVMVVCASRKEKGDEREREREKREKDDACGSSVVRSSLHRFLKVPWSGVWLCACSIVEWSGVCRESARGGVLGVAASVGARAEPRPASARSRWRCGRPQAARAGRSV